jgi:Kef-type K+ transport system membrane component KefB
MGLATSSTSLALMTLSRTAEQGRNASSLNLSDALGASLFVGVSGTIFAALRTTTSLSVTFGTVIGAMAVLALLAALAAVRIGPVHNEFTAR